MTILSKKRAVSNNYPNNNGAESGGNINQTTSRSRDDRNANGEAVPATVRVPIQFNNKRTEKNVEKRFKENACEIRERDRQKRLALRSKRKQAVRAKGVVNQASSEVGMSVVENASKNDGVCAVAATKILETNIVEDCNGWNSEDEYDFRRPLTVADPSDKDWATKDAHFSQSLTKLGFEIKQIAEDGACLFRAIADQLCGDQEMHYTVRSQCMDYIVKNRAFFAPYVTEDFDRYVNRKRKWNVHGNHLEMQAISELYNRKIEVYCYHSKPINIYNAFSSNSYEPIRVSYHRMCHYNSIINPKKPSVSVGLGLLNYYTRYDVKDRRETPEAAQQNEDLLIEQAMLEDKIKATDWEATNEAIEEQVARESYIQYYRDEERRLKSKSLSNYAAAGCSSTMTSVTSSSSSIQKASTSPKGCASHKESPFPKRGHCVQVSNSKLNAVPETIGSACDTSINYNQHLQNDATRGNNSPSKQIEFLQKTDTFPNVNSSATVRNKEEVENLDNTIMFQVLAESQSSYFKDLKRKICKQNGSSDPPASH